MKFASITCSIITFFMATLHLSLLFGAPIGEYVLGGKEKVIPPHKRWINAIFILLFGFLGLLYLGNGTVFGSSFSPLVTKIIMGVYTVFLAYAILGNTFFTDSKKEKYVMIPASVIGFISSLLTLILSFT